MVNRIWQHHFGEGIVRTPSDFGINGDRPSHPELLDWLATQFVEKKWSLKAMHKLMLLSNTYRQSTAHPAVRASTPKPIRRTAALAHELDRGWKAETIRDSMLAASGQLQPSEAAPASSSMSRRRRRRLRVLQVVPVRPDKQQARADDLHLPAPLAS